MRCQSVAMNVPTSSKNGNSGKVVLKLSTAF